MTDRFPEELPGSDKKGKQTWWSNDETIIELGYRKMSWLVSVSQINYFGFWQITDLLATVC